MSCGWCAGVESSLTLLRTVEAPPGSGKSVVALARSADRTPRADLWMRPQLQLQVARAREQRLPRAPYRRVQAVLRMRVSFALSPPARRRFADPLRRSFLATEELVTSLSTAPPFAPTTASELEEDRSATPAVTSATLPGAAPRLALPLLTASSPPRSSTPSPVALELPSLDVDPSPAGSEASPDPDVEDSLEDTVAVDSSAPPGSSAATPVVSPTTWLATAPPTLELELELCPVSALPRLATRYVGRSFSAKARSSLLHSSRSRAYRTLSTLLQCHEEGHIARECPQDEPLPQTVA